MVVAFCTTLTIFGTIAHITAGTAVVGTGCTVGIATAGIAIGTGGRISGGIGGGADSTLSSRRTTR